MEKDYQTWSPLKQRINNALGRRAYFHEREVWYCHQGQNVGFEQDGKGDSFLRPVVVVRKFNQDIFWAVPLTSTPKISTYYQPVHFGRGGSSSAILSQIRLMDAKRLSHKIGVVSREEFGMVTKKLKELIP